MSIWSESRRIALIIHRDSTVCSIEALWYNQVRNNKFSKVVTSLKIFLTLAVESPDILGHGREHEAVSWFVSTSVFELPKLWNFIFLRKPSGWIYELYLLRALKCLTLASMKLFHLIFHWSRNKSSGDN